MIWAMSQIKETAPAPAKPKDDPAAAPPSRPKAPAAPAPTTGKAAPKEIGGLAGPEPTRYGDWEIKGRCIDF